MLKFRHIEDDLRKFFGRAIQELTSHSANPLAEFVKPHTDSRVAAIEDLELPTVCHVLLKGYVYDRPHRTGVLFGRHLVEAGLDRDIRYCQGLRNKYAHLRGSEEIPPRDEFSDLVIIARTVRSLLENRQRSDADKALIARLDEHTTRLVEELAAAALPEKYDVEDQAQFTEAQCRQLTEIVAAILAQRNTEASVEQATTPRHESTIIASLADIRVELDRQRASVTETAKQMADLAAVVTKNIEGMAVDAVSATQEDDQDDSEIMNALDALLAAELYTIEPTDPPRTVRARNGRRYSVEEARWKLQSLRRRIWKETGSGPSSDGLLRKSMIELMLYYRPTSIEDFFASQISIMFDEVAADQKPYLNEVLDILSGIED